jgi:hypothetical protein
MHHQDKACVGHSDISGMPQERITSLTVELASSSNRQREILDQAATTFSLKVIERRAF